MGNRRFSMTTYMLVGLSLVALYLVGKTVTPPPPAPPAPPPPARAPEPAPTALKKAVPDIPGMVPDPPGSAERIAKDRAAQMDRMMAQHKKEVASAPKAGKFNPTSIETGADYWQHAEMGQKGAAEMRVKVAKALEEQKHAAPLPPRKAVMNTPITPP